MYFEIFFTVLFIWKYNCKSKTIIIKFIVKVIRCWCFFGTFKNNCFIFLVVLQTYDLENINASPECSVYYMKNGKPVFVEK